MNKTKLIMFFLLLFLGVGNALAQKTISGKITGEDGEPIPGASITVKGTTTGTISSYDGTYILTVPQNTKSDTLQYSYIGMETVAEAINGRTTINVTLSNSDVAVDEVVVTALGISKNQKALGYAATKVSSDEIAISKNANVMGALSGKVAGVDIMGNAGPGSSQNVMIRGAASLSNNQPLYIVDGVPLINKQVTTGDNLNYNTDMGTGLNAVNPNDIESMTVLKGAAATALYGSRAANGVIMITTKSGSNTNGRLNIDYDGNFAVERVGYISKAQDMFGQGWYGMFSREENGNWGPAYTNQPQPWGYTIDNQQQVANYSFLDTRLRDFYELGFNNSHSLSLSGGNATTNYYFSVANDSENGVIPGDHDTYNRTTLSTRGSHKFNRVKITTSANFSNEKTLAIPSGQGASIIKALWDSPANISLVDLKDMDNKFNKNDNYFTPFGYNPYYVIENFVAEQHRNKLYGKAQADVDICKDLKLTYRFGGDVENSKTDSKRNSIKFTPGSVQDGLGTEYDGYYSQIKRTRYEINNDVYLSYNKAINDDFNISAIAGFSAQEEGYNYMNAEISNLVLEGFYDLTNSTADPSTDQYHTKVRRLGVYANVDLDYKRMLYLTLTGRNDWSSTLPVDNRSYFYPGVTLSWIFTELGNDGKLGPLTFGKARASYGMTGKDASAYYVYDYYLKAYAANYGYGSVNYLEFPLAGSNSWAVSNTMGNPNLKPELTTEYEFGLELVFLNGRFGIDGDFYNKFTKDLINGISLDNSTGYTYTYANIGDIRNKGYELNGFVYPIKAKDFNWKISANFSQNFNKVEDLMLDELYLSGYSGCGIYAVKREPVGQFKTNVARKVKDEKGASHVVVDNTGNPLASVLTEYVDKDVNEKFRLGFTTRFEYKNFSLEGTFDYHHGGYIYCHTKEYQGWTGSGLETVVNDRNPYVIPGSVVEVKSKDDADFEYDGVFYAENMNSVSNYNKMLHTFYSDGGVDKTNGFIIDRSYLKLRNVSFSYTMPARIVSRMKLQKVAFSLTASNILLWTPKENSYIDPECTSFDTGIGAKFGEYFTNPTNQVYTFGVSVGF